MAIDPDASRRALLDLRRVEVRSGAGGHEPPLGYAATTTGVVSCSAWCRAASRSRNVAGRISDLASNSQRVQVRAGLELYPRDLPVS